ncbi:hypothetical protein OG320_27330 [Microbispora sp. NBC_01189]|nr:hypothetical protein OG320_27330 [Microbispora sp. NBC_01189]
MRAIEEAQDVVGVRVEIGGRDRRVVVVRPQTGQGQRVNGMTGGFQQRDHLLERPGAVPPAGHEDERRHAEPSRDTAPNRCGRNRREG